MKKKNNKIRACLDFSIRLNNRLETYNYPQPSPEDTFAKLSDGKVFTKLDLSEAHSSDSCQWRMCEVFNYKDAKRSV